MIWIKLTQLLRFWQTNLDHLTDYLEIYSNWAQHASSHLHPNWRWRGLKVPLMRSRMTLSVYRHSGGSGLRPKPAGFLVPPPPSQGVNTPTRSTGHHVRVNSRQHILQHIKMCSRSICFYIRVYSWCKPTRGQNFSKVNMWAGVCLTLGFLSAFLHVCFFLYYLSYLSHLSLSGLLSNTGSVAMNSCYQE